MATPKMSTVSSLLKLTLPKLPYDYNALEPIICREIMELHHQKHHQAYVNGFNAAHEKLIRGQEASDVTEVIKNFNALRFNGGGHINHCIFWNNLAPGSSAVSEKLGGAIERAFGGLDGMKKILAEAAVGVQGSGWGWLGYSKQEKTLVVATTLAQDPLEATTGIIPLLGIDVWEHAYYLQYKNVRADYVKAIFDIINWNDVSERYEKEVC